MGDGPFVRPKAAKVGSVKVPVVFTDSTPQSMRSDEGQTYQYIGHAPIGSSESSAVWRICRLTVANPQALMWADGDDAYDNVWSSRASLVYS